MNQQIEVLSDKNELIERAVEIITQTIKEQLEQAGFQEDETNTAQGETTLTRPSFQFTLALAGGSTPKPIYQALAKQDLPWSKLQIFWGDERYVASDHPDSNQNMVRQAWLNHVDIPEENIHPVNTDAGSPDEAAAEYEATIKRVFQTRSTTVPAFDLILLGMGDDGHTASLFPHTEALTVQNRLVTVGYKHQEPRISFTVPLINQAKFVMFLVAGANKQDALAQVMSQGDSLTYPARRVKPQGRLKWLLDRAAAGKITTNL